MKFRRKSKNPVGTVHICIPGRDPKKGIKIMNREIYETDDDKVIKILEKDENVEKVGEMSGKKGKKNN